MHANEFWFWRLLLLNHTNNRRICIPYRKTSKTSPVGLISNETRTDVAMFRTLTTLKNKREFCIENVFWSTVLTNYSIYINHFENKPPCILFKSRLEKIPISKTSPSKGLKVTDQFERCFRLMEHISVISCRNPINLYVTGELIKLSK